MFCTPFKLANTCVKDLFHNSFSVEHIDSFLDNTHSCLNKSSFIFKQIGEFSDKLIHCQTNSFILHNFVSCLINKSFTHLLIHLIFS